MPCVDEVLASFLINIWQVVICWFVYEKMGHSSLQNTGFQALVHRQTHSNKYMELLTNLITGLEHKNLKQAKIYFFIMFGGDRHRTGIFSFHISFVQGRTRYIVTKHNSICAGVHLQEVCDTVCHLKRWEG